MKKNLFISFALVATLFVNAQQKNTLLEQSFWKTSPDVNAVKAEIAKGNSPSAATPNAFDVTVMAINNDAPAATIQFLLEQPGNEVSKLTHDNRIYLHWAANKGNVAIVEYLISKGSDLNLEDSKGETPLTFAAIGGQNNTALYDAFFKAGTDPKKKYKDGVNLLLMAIASDKNLALTTYFTTKGMSIKDTDSDGNTAFDYAAKSGNLPLLKSLLEKGVKNTDSALLFAAQGSRRDVTPLETYKYLVEDLKIKPTATSKSGETVLHLLASKPNQTEIINYFLSKGVDANKVNNEGNTAVMASASARDNAVLELLLPIVKNNNVQNLKGESALTMAIKAGTPEAVALLLNKGADAKVLDKDGNNLGYYLIQSYKPSGRGPEATTQDPFETKIKLLQDKGLNLATPQKDGNTLYHFAIIKNDLALLKKIGALNIDINAKNKDGLTALHKAAMISKDDAILKYLVSIGAKTDIITDFDESAYALAQENETLTKNKISLDFLK
ncbi:ankyrin repeat domain-containing protein [Flavobacterium sandaracinum]|uniref:Ankyrin repeat domain-containing protein n=1 Tax=Flavobacterium sandaracinum TaxID=2541733 RepID=A0A4R5CWR3_9FLAO|nr:ankyrin repeat domain-containing protein [Flavobacterium sandaracinum]TDE02253.1 ankyrin repeat domain-containing protein [Flavobacterium sandaracinum]